MAKSLFLPFLLLFLLAAGGGSEIFSFKNSGMLRGGDMEDHANYRAHPVASSNSMFQLVFFNTTPSAYALGISMGVSGQVETKRIVWAANMNDLVTENSTLQLTDDGKLLIFRADGSIAWSSNTSGRGVVGCELRNNGNLVLYNEHNKMVWESFDYPTDSLLVGQSLNNGGVNKLVSRTSERDGSEGPYWLEIEAGGLVLYSSNLSEKWTLPFHDRGPRDSDAITNNSNKPVNRATFGNDPEGKHGCHHMIELTLANSTSEESNTALYCLNAPGFNTNRSFLRVGSDGELKIYSYSQFHNWDITYLRSGCWQGVPQCDLVTKNGASKAVPRSCQCVACTQADGFEGSGSCALPSLADSKEDTSCNSSSGLYELEGPEHFSSHHVSENSNPIGETESEECRRKCSHDDCYTCAAFSLWKHSPACLRTKELGNRTNFVKKKV